MEELVDVVIGGGARPSSAAHAVTPLLRAAAAAWRASTS